MTTIKMLNNGTPIPFYATEGAAAFDIASAEDVTLVGYNDTALISTGLFLEIPRGYELQLRPRSGLALKQTITVLNAPATIDADFRGEIKVLLINHNEHSFTINKGDRIAQAVLAPVVQATFELVDALDDTQRGASGFGSTGA